MGLGLGGKVGDLVGYGLCDFFEGGVLEMGLEGVEVVEFVFD